MRVALVGMRLALDLINLSDVRVGTGCAAIQMIYGCCVFITPSIMTVSRVSRAEVLGTQAY